MELYCNKFSNILVRQNFLKDVHKYVDLPHHFTLTLYSYLSRTNVFVFVSLHRHLGILSPFWEVEVCFELLQPTHSTFEQRPRPTQKQSTLKPKL